MARLGLEPRLAALCIAGAEAGQGDLACVSAAILSERPPAVKPSGDSLGPGKSGPGSNSFEPLRDGDFRESLALFRRSPHDPWTKQVGETARDLLARLGLKTALLSWKTEDEADIGELLAAAFPDRIANLQESGKFRFVSGREARIEGPLENAEWLAAAEVDAGERLAFIRLAAPLSKERALKLLESTITAETSVEWKGLVPRTVVVRRAGRLVISEERRASLRQEAAADLGRYLAEAGIGALPWESPRGDEKAAPRRLLERIRFFAAHDDSTSINSNTAEKNDVDRNTADKDAADWSDEALIKEAADWLGPFLWDGAEKGGGPAVTASSLMHALEGRLGWEKSRRFAETVPEAFTLPGGGKRLFDYASGEPVLSLRLQDAFGITGQQRVLGRPVVFHLLSPAARPIQITADLEGFWAGSYAEVRREMRGRYPKHRWPENPRI
jgi:ATP-dependent helicase HrpB